MEDVFEKFIRGFDRLEQTDFPSVGSVYLHWNATSEAAEDMDFLPSMKTDVTLRSESRMIVIDAKYYKDALQTHREKRTGHSGNLYQLMAYLRNVERHWRGRAPEGILLYPVAASRADLRYTIDGYPPPGARLRHIEPGMTSGWPVIRPLRELGIVEGG